MNCRRFALPWSVLRPAAAVLALQLALLVAAHAQAPAIAGETGRSPEPARPESAPEALSVQELVALLDEKEQAYEEATAQIALAQRRIEHYRQLQEDLRLGIPEAERTLEYERLLYDLDRFTAYAREMMAFHRQRQSILTEEMVALERQWTPYEVASLENVTAFDPLPPPPEERRQTTSELLDALFAETLGTVGSSNQAQLTKYRQFLNNDSAQRIAIERMKQNEVKLLGELDAAYEIWLEQMRRAGRPTTALSPPPGYEARQTLRQPQTPSSTPLRARPLPSGS